MLAFLACFPGLSLAQSVVLSGPEIDQALRHGPWPQDAPRDPSNRFDGDPRAVALGAALFTSPALSGDGQFSCASCHNPGLHFTDGLAQAEGRRTLARNTLGLFNLPFQRWFGWDGQSDNLWAQTIVPILHPDEMALPLGAVRSVALQTPGYSALFGDPADQGDQEVLVNLTKALAAYQATLVTGQTPFDRFRDALADGDLATAAQYPQAAQRGLSLFLGRGNCSFCHSGPLFSNGEFHDAGMEYFTKDGVDTGRHGGINALLASPYTLDGVFSDDPEKSGGWKVRQLSPQHSDFGTFRVPGLRNVALTAPYMHDGSLPDLAAVVQHYATIDLERMHSDGEAILTPLALTPQEAADLVAFLEGLTEDQKISDSP